MTPNEKHVLAMLLDLESRREDDIFVTSLFNECKLETIPFFTTIRYLEARGHIIIEGFVLRTDITEI